jgi:hypothetical protein
MPTTARTHAASRVRHAGLLLAVAVMAMLAPTSNARAATTLTFNTAPVLGTLSGVTLNGKTQTTTTSTTLNDFAVTSSGTNAGWNMTVASVTGGSNSSVFKEYCPNATCGTDTGPGYVTGGYTLPADSLTLNTAAATISGTGATKPTFQCSVSPFCNVDTTTASKVLSASTAVSLAKWTAAGTSTLSLTTPANLHKLQTNEVYRINLVWTINSGP